MRNDEFMIIVNQYEKLVFTICYQLIKDYHEAQNLTQETFLSAYTHIDTCDLSYIKPWISRIAANKAKDFLKSAYHKKVTLDDDTLKTSFDNSSIEEEVISYENKEIIKSYIYKLKEPYLKVSVLRFIKEKNTSEIALILKRPKKTVETQLLRAKAMLRQIIKEGGI